MAVEVGGCAENTVGQRAAHILVERGIRGRPELAEIIAVSDVDVGILTGADKQMSRHAINIDHIGQ